MRCQACDKGLSDSESTNKFLISGKYADMCVRCLIPIAADAPTELTPSPEKGVQAHVDDND